MARKKQEKSAGSPGRRGPKDRKPKVQRTVVRGSREREPDWGGEHDSEAGEYPFYRLDASTQHFKFLAHVALRVEWIKGSYLGPDLQSKTMDAKVVGDDKSNESSQSALSPDDAVPLDQAMREIAQMLGYGDMYAAHESENERFDWISRDPLMRDIARMIARGDWKGLQRITDVVGNYETAYEKQSAGQTTATVWTITACDSLYEEGLYRNQVTKAEIQARAERFWARAMCHRKRVPPTPENIEKEKSKLSTIRWQRVWELLALEDITNAPAGRPPKNR
jgi:hypothetical protein